MNNKGFSSFKEETMQRYLLKSPLQWKVRGFVQVSNQVVFDKKLCPRDIRVYLALLAHQFKGKTQCNPAVELLEEETGISRPKIIEAIKVLENQGWLQVERSHRKVNIYHVKLKK